MNRNLGPFLRCLDDLRDKPITVALCDNPPRMPKSAAAKRLQEWGVNMYQMSREERLEERIRGMKPQDKVAELWDEFRGLSEEFAVVSNRLADLEDICQDVVAGDETAMEELKGLIKHRTQEA